MSDISNTTNHYADGTRTASWWDVMPSASEKAVRLWSDKTAFFKSRYTYLRAMYADGKDDMVALQVGETEDQHGRWYDIWVKPGHEAGA
jgi:hypothetical protein